MFVRAQCLIIVICLFSCGTADADAPSQIFRPRQEALFSSELTQGDLRVTVANAIPQIDVPQPHIPTVVHLNAQLCSVVPQSARKKTTDAEGRECLVRFAGTKRCLALSPSIYANTTVHFGVERSAYLPLLNGDFQSLEVSFQSSSQTTQLHYRCRGSFGEIDPSSDRLNELNITVDGQHSLAFSCR